MLRFRGTQIQRGKGTDLGNSALKLAPQKGMSVVEESWATVEMAEPKLAYSSIRF